MRRWITFVAALLVGIAMGQLGAQPSRASDLNVRAVGVRAGSATLNNELVRVALQWTDDVVRVRSLLQQGADPNPIDSGHVLLSIAAVHDNRRIVRELFAAGARLHASVFAGPDGLAWAARLAQPEIVATLLEKGADPNVYDAEGFTPLLRVAYHEGSFPFVPAHASTYATVAELLLARGADPELPKRQPSGERVIRETVGPNDVHGSTTLAIASGNCADGLVALLVRRGANVSKPGAMNMPPLMHAAQHGCEDAVKLLLEANADPNQTGHQGETALVMAALQTHYGLEHVRIVELLLRAGATREVARARLGERLRDKYYRTYLLRGRTNAERIHRLLGG